jgi:hypothetical protein
MSKAYHQYLAEKTAAALLLNFEPQIFFAAD